VRYIVNPISANVEITVMETVRFERSPVVCRALWDTSLMRT